MRGLAPYGTVLRIKGGTRLPAGLVLNLRLTVHGWSGGYRSRTDRVGDRVVAPDRVGVHVPDVLPALVVGRDVPGVARQVVVRVGVDTSLVEVGIIVRIRLDDRSRSMSHRRIWVGSEPLVLWWDPYLVRMEPVKLKICASCKAVDGEHRRRGVGVVLQLREEV